MLSDRDYDLISGYLDDVLSESERAEVESRLVTDSEFANELNAIRRTIALVKSLPELTAPRDFRLTREQAADIDRENAQMSWPSKRNTRMSWPSKRAPIAFRQALVPLMSAAASVVMILAGFIALVGSPAGRATLNSAGVAMLDTSIQTETAAVDPADTTFESVVAASPQNSATAPAPIAPTGEESETAGNEPGSGGGFDGDETVPPAMGGAGEMGEMSGTPDEAMTMMMVPPEGTPLPTMDDAMAVRSSAPAMETEDSNAMGEDSTDLVPLTFDAPNATNTDFMSESLPAATPTLTEMVVPMPVIMATPSPAATDSEIYGYQVSPTQVAAIDVQPQTDVQDAAADNVEDMATTLKAEEGSTGWISPLGGMILLILGLALGMTSGILFWRNR